MFRGRLHTVLLAMAALSCTPGGATGGRMQPGEVAIDQRADGSTVELRQGQGLTVSLPGNPTTGFVWELLPQAESVLVSAGDPGYIAASVKLGAGGVYRFTFQAARRGSATLKLIYHRPFEKGAAPADSFEVTVVVD